MAEAKLDHVRRVHIGGEVLQVRSDAPPETIEEVAAVVDTHVRRLQASGVETDRFRLGVLAALHVAGELFEARAARDEAVAARDGILARLAESMDSRTRAESERDAARDEAIAARDAACAVVKGEENGDAAAERDAALERCEALQTELDGYRNRLENILKRLEGI